MLIGLIGGTFLLPLFFAIWLGINLDRDLIRSCEDYGSRKTDSDQFFVALLFVIWLAGILFGYFCWNIQGAIIANFINGAVGGAILGYWYYQQQKSEH